MRISNGFAFLAILWIGCMTVSTSFSASARALREKAPANLRSADSQDNPARAVYKKVVPSLLAVIALDQNNQPLGQGAGFYIRPHLLATNLHVIREAHSLRVWEAATHKAHMVRGIQAVSSKNDLAILRMEDNGRPLPLASAPLKAGDTVYTLGNPVGLETTCTVGIVAGLRRLGTISMYQATNPLSPGSSGGPVVNPRGEVVGLSASYLVEGQNLNFVLDVRNLTNLEAAQAGKDVQPLSFLATLTPGPEDAHTSALQSLHITAPEVHWGHSPDRKTHTIDWNLSVKNEGDRSVKNVDLLILVFDRKSKDMIHYVRKKLSITIPGKLARRTLVESGELDFDTDEADRKWIYEYRILGFDYAADQEP